MYQWLLWIRKPSNSLWVMPTLGALLAVVFALAASLGTRYLEADILPDIERKVLDGLLDVIASSMLAVSTFSLSIMVSAFASAASSATPRATELVMADDNTRVAIASFISAFIYAIIAKIVLSVGYYGQNGRFILFISTVFVLGYLIFTLIRWVHTLSQLGRMGNTLNKIYQTEARSLRQYRKNPSMGAAWRAVGLERSWLVKAPKSGYLADINMAALQEWAGKKAVHIHLCVRPGDYMLPGRPLMMVLPDGSDSALSRSEDEAAKLVTMLTVESERSFTQDPRFGMIVLSEVAQRALSPAVNDPGTAFSVLTLMTQLLLDEVPDEVDEPGLDRLSMVALNEGDLLSHAIDPIGRDAAGNIEVSMRMQKMLSALSNHAPEAGVRRAALKQAELVFQRALQALPCEEDKIRLTAERQRHFGVELTQSET